MVYTLEVPNEYGWVVLGAGVGSIVCNIVLSGPVMKGRTELNVPYPNLYATPGVHKHADEFNRIQRSHQNYMEMLDSYIAMTLLGGLKYPLACAAGSVLYYTGCILYQKGYIDSSLDVKTARYKKGGAIKWIGFLTSMISTIALGVSMITAK
eukprot:CAMPEP_0116137350 /NCGR_PEP_ID=MMETSP0329-20121206/12203_1 /TAXON_ID=697910 /ORGANISM="Pseudo-nitzschia arenysensis, Strain B593" /LENGTH=151 /DNA_ID=CAMNT_0003632263 /DNA_START=96 /DNA_END=551 /DNA_ORIENTATION=-